MKTNPNQGTPSSLFFAWNGWCTWCTFMKRKKVQDTRPIFFLESYP